MTIAYKFNPFTINLDIVPSGSGGVSIGDTVTGGTQGSVLFIGASSVLAQDNANFFWDDANNRLGIGTTSPAEALQVTGNIRASNDYFIGSDRVFRVLTGGGSAGNLQLGVLCGNLTMTGTSNTIIGYNCATNLAGGVQNVIIGTSTGQELTSGSNNMFLGRAAGQSTTTGSGNVFCGFSAGINNVSGGGNVFFGDGAGENSVGNSNVIVGTSGYTAGDNSIAIGAGTNVTATSNATAIGYGAQASQNNTVILGNDCDVGIGTITPRARLHVLDDSVLGSNIVSNGDFSSDTTGWTADNANLSSVAGGESGNCLQIESTGFDYATAYQVLTTTANKTYIANIYMKYDVDSTYSFGQIKVSDDNFSSGNLYFLDSNQFEDWTLITFSFVSTNTTTYLSLINSGGAFVGANQKFFFDTVSVQEVTGGDAIINNNLTISTLDSSYSYTATILSPASATASLVPAPSQYVSGDTAQYRVYSYKTLAGTKYYSPLYTETNELTFTTNNNRVADVTWDAVSGASGYFLIRNFNGGGWTSWYYDFGNTTEIFDTNNIDTPWVNDDPTSIISTDNTLTITTYLNYAPNDTPYGIYTDKGGFFSFIDFASGLSRLSNDGSASFANGAIVFFAGGDATFANNAFAVYTDGTFKVGEDGLTILNADGSASFAGDSARVNDDGTFRAVSGTFSNLTSGVIPVASTGGLLIDSTPSSAYTPTNVTTDRSYNANATTVDELADVLGTLIADLQAKGILG